MKEHIKIVLIILAFVLIIVLLFRPYSCSSRPSNDSGEEFEHYDAAFDSKYIDPRVNPYSKDIVYRPDTNVRFGLDDIANTDSTKIFDHLADQKRGLNEYDNTYDTDPKHNIIKPFNGRQPDVNETVRERLKRVRDAVNRPSHFESDTKIVEPPYASSYTDTEINADRMNESNNIVRYCANPSPDQGNDILTASNTNVPTDRPYAMNPKIMMDGQMIGQMVGQMDNQMDNQIDANMDMNDKEYNNMMTSRPNMKTYIRINDEYGRFIKKDRDVDKDIVSLAEITNVMDAYRDKALNSIQGCYRDGSASAAAKTGIGMY